MGKIRVKALGDEGLEKEQKKEARLARETRQAQKRKEAKMSKAPGLKGGERVVGIGPSEEEIEKQLEEEKKAGLKPAEQEQEDKKVSKKTKKKTKARKRSPRYTSAKALIDKKLFTVSEALDLLEKLNRAKFDETVELHINTIEAVSGNFTLPHGTGKKTKVAIADDKLIAEIEKGKIDFDILLAQPQMMPKLGKVAKILGPRGLMPNPKNGTISQNPEEAAKKYEGGQINFKTESKSPILHLVIGKASFGKSKLFDNAKTVFQNIAKGKIRKVVLKSTMSPAIKIDFVQI